MILMWPCSVLMWVSVLMLSAMAIEMKIQLSFNLLYQSWLIWAHQFRLYLQIISINRCDDLQFKTSLSILDQFRQLMLCIPFNIHTGELNYKITFFQASQLCVQKLMRKYYYCLHKLKQIDDIIMYLHQPVNWAQQAIL